MYRLICCSTAIIAITSLVFARTPQPRATNMDALPSLRLVEELRIGSARDPNVGFSRIGSIAVDRDANLYVFESQDLHIRVYSNTGSLVRTVGRKGEGPGEFAQPAIIGIKGDTLWAFSSRTTLGTLTLFNRRDGKLISTTPVPGAQARARSGSLLLLPIGMRSDGTLISGSYLVLQLRGVSAGGVGATDPLPVPRILFGLDGKVIDTVARHLEPLEVRRSPQQIVTTSSGQRRVVPLPPLDSDLSLYTIDGRFAVQRHVAPNSSVTTFTVTKEDVRGTATWTRRYEYRPVQYTQEVLNRIAIESPLAIGPAAAATAGATSQPALDTSADVRTMIRRAMQYPANQVAVHVLFSGADGSLLMQRELSAGSARRWDLLDPQGNPRGRIDIPNGVRVRWQSGNVVWATQNDADDVPWLVRFRISGANDDF